MAEKKKTPTTKAIRKTTEKKAKPQKTETMFFSKDDAYYFGQGVHYDIIKSWERIPQLKTGKKGISLPCGHRMQNM